MFVMRRIFKFVFGFSWIKGFGYYLVMFVIGKGKERRITIIVC